MRQAGERLKSLRAELRVIDEQFAHLAEEADDMGIRSLVAETPGAAYEFRHAQEHADAMAGHRAHVVNLIAELEQRQDALLDRISGQQSP